MIKIKEVKIPLYDQTVYIILGDPYEVQDYLRDAYRGDFSFDPSTSNAVALHRKLTSWIWFDLETVTVPIIAHELSHAVFDLMLDIGLELSDQEAFCYIIEYLMEPCVELFAIQMDLTSLRKEILGKEDEQASS